jgi:hypothetical protein
MIDSEVVKAVDQLPAGLVMNKPLCYINYRSTYERTHPGD